MSINPQTLGAQAAPPAPVDVPLDPNRPWAPPPPPPPDTPKHLVVGNDDWTNWMNLEFSETSSDRSRDEHTYRDGPLASAYHVDPEVQQGRWNEFGQRESPALIPPAVPPTPGVHISGGVGGTSAHLQDLDAVARRLDRATPYARQIDQQFEELSGNFGVWARRISRKLQDRITPWTSAPLHAGALQIVEEVELAGVRAKNSAWDAGTAALVTKRDIDDLARSVAGARSLYTEADSAAEESMSWFSDARDVTSRMSTGNPMAMAIHQWISVAQGVTLLGMDQTFGWASERVSPVREDVVEDLASSLARPLPMPWQRASVPGEDVAAVSGAITGLLRPLDQSGPRTGVAVSVPTPATLPVVRSAQDAAAGVQKLYRLDELEAGSIAIQKNTLPDGEITWVVMVPGTQGGVEEDHQFDWLSNFSLMSNEDGPPTQTVRDAMRQAGINSEEKVTMFGHSQGGLATIDVSNSEEFNVTHVLTMGTPTALRRSNPSTQYLAVEAQGDVVPALDASKNSDRPNQTTVRADRKRMANAEGLEDFSPHSIENYCGLLEEVERVDNPSTTAFFKGMQDEIFEKPIPTSQGQYRSEPELMTFRSASKGRTFRRPFQRPFERPFQGPFESPFEGPFEGSVTLR